MDDLFHPFGPLNDPDPEFDEWAATMPEKFWARYDMSAVRLGWVASKICLLTAQRSHTDNG